MVHMEFASKYSQPSVPVELVGHILLVVTIAVILLLAGTSQILTPGGLGVAFTGTIALRYYFWGDSRTRTIAGHVLAIVGIGLGLMALTNSYWTYLPEIIVSVVGVYLASRYLLRLLRAIERIAAALDKISKE